VTAPYGQPAAPAGDVQQMLAQAKTSIRELKRLGGDTAEAQSWLMRAEESFGTGILSTTRIYAEYAMGAAQSSLEEINRLLRRIEEDAQRAMEEAKGRPEVIRQASIALELVAAGRLEEARDAMRACEAALREMESSKTYGAPSKVRGTPGASMGTCPVCGNFVQGDWIVCKYCETPLREKGGKSQVERLGSTPLRESGAPTDSTLASSAPLAVAVPAEAGPQADPSDSQVVPAAIAVGFMAPPKDGPKCPVCDEVLDPSWRKCPNCNAMVGGSPAPEPAAAPTVSVAIAQPDSTPSAALDTTPRCPSCGEGIETDWKKCPNCQGDLRPGESPLAPPAVAVAIEFPGGVTAQEAMPVFSPVVEAIEEDGSAPMATVQGQSLSADAGSPAIAAASPVGAPPSTVPPTRICVNCGDEFPEGGRFCGSCGAPPPP